MVNLKTQQFLSIILCSLNCQTLGSLHIIITIFFPQITMLRNTIEFLRLTRSKPHQILVNSGEEYVYTHTHTHTPTHSNTETMSPCFGCYTEISRGLPSGVQFSSVQFSRSVVSDSLRPHESQHARPPYPSPTPGVHSDSRPLSQ